VGTQLRALRISPAIPRAAVLFLRPLAEAIFLGEREAGLGRQEAALARVKSISLQAWLRAFRSVEPPKGRRPAPHSTVD
jgi:hypothetical protein